MGDSWQIVLGLLASVGGIGAIFIAVVKFSSNIIARRLEERYSLKLNKELERYKSNLENKIYISKVRFDLEIETYHQLSEAVLQMVWDSYELFPTLGSSHPDEDVERKRKEEKYSKAIDSYNQANRAIMKNAPFIPKDIFELFSDIKMDCRRQINWFPDFMLGRLCIDGRRELIDQKNACWKRSETIN